MIPGMSCSRDGIVLVLMRGEDDDGGVGRVVEAKGVHLEAASEQVSLKVWSEREGATGRVSMDEDGRKEVARETDEVKGK